MRRLAVLLIGLLALWAAPFAARALNVSGGGGIHTHANDAQGGATIAAPSIVSATQLTIGSLEASVNPAIRFAIGVAEWPWEIENSGQSGFFRPDGDLLRSIGDTTHRVTRVHARVVDFDGMLFSNLASFLASNGRMTYCTDCTIANPCAGGGTGAFAKRINGVNVCN
jgi:hypothetical protein